MARTAGCILDALLLGHQTALSTTNPAVGFVVVAMEHRVVVDGDRDGPGTIPDQSHAWVAFQCRRIGAPVALALGSFQALVVWGLFLWAVRSAVV